MKFVIVISIIFLYVVHTDDFLENSNQRNNKNTKQNIKGICSLTGASSADPFPSLSKCYQYNNNACCTSVHDDIISQMTSNLLTDPCLRKYPELEQLMCLGCHPLEFSYIDVETKTLNICMSFAMLLWDASQEEELYDPTRKYDNCGFKVPEHLKNVTKYQNYIIPSESFANITKFIESIQIPFYETYKINIVNDKKDSSINCFASGNFLKTVLLINIFIVCFFF
jgi:hypothetical protein